MPVIITPAAELDLAESRDWYESIRPGLSRDFEVSAILSSLDPPADARIVRLRGLSEREDIEQWIAHRRDCGLTDAEIFAELVALIAAAG